MKKAKLILYGREECHLCEQMVEEINQFKTRYVWQMKLDIIYIDIDSDSKLVELYNQRVPLLIEKKNNTIKELCEYFFDPDTLINYFSIAD